VSRLRSHQPDVGPRFVWRTFWRHARRGDAPRCDLAKKAGDCLEARDRAVEEAERQETQPGRAGYVFRNRSSIAWRALARRGWSIAEVGEALRFRGLVVDQLPALAVEVLRAERAAVPRA
jgi:hypothetical protein